MYVLLYTIQVCNALIVLWNTHIISILIRSYVLYHFYRDHISAFDLCFFILCCPFYPFDYSFYFFVV